MPLTPPAPFQKPAAKKPAAKKPKAEGEKKAKKPAAKARQLMNDGVACVHVHVPPPLCGWLLFACARRQCPSAS